jgi:hypothetical protein
MGAAGTSQPAAHFSPAPERKGTSGLVGKAKLVPNPASQNKACPGRHPPRGRPKHRAATVPMAQLKPAVQRVQDPGACLKTVTFSLSLFSPEAEIKARIRSRMKLTSVTRLERLCPIKLPPMLAGAAGCMIAAYFGERLPRAMKKSGDTESGK